MNIQDYLNHSKISFNESGDLVLFSYTRECQWERVWDPIILSARGLIFDKVTGELIFRCMKKFFNLSEMPETQFQNLPDLPFTVTRKLDGILGLMYQHRGETYVSTRGSLTSTYAYWATDWVRANVNINNINPNLSYHFEILYKGGRIVIDYGDNERLVLICAIETKTGRELSYSELKTEGERLDVEVVDIIEAGSIGALYEIAKTLDATEEGFVVTFSNGLKVKIKGSEYCRIHKAISKITPLDFWRNWEWDNSLNPPGVSKEFLSTIPEEFREETERIKNSVNEFHLSLFSIAKAKYDHLFSSVGGPFSDKKSFALYVLRYHKKDASILLGYSQALETGSWGGFWRNIHSKARPTMNVLPDSF